MISRELRRRQFVRHIAGSIAGTALAQPFTLFAQTMPDTARVLVGLPPGGSPI